MITEIRKNPIKEKGKKNTETRAKCRLHCIWDPEKFHLDEEN